MSCHNIASVLNIFLKGALFVRLLRLFCFVPCPVPFAVIIIIGCILLCFFFFFFFFFFYAHIFRKMAMSTYLVPLHSIVKGSLWHSTVKGRPLVQSSCGNPSRLHLNLKKKKNPTN